MLFSSFWKRGPGPPLWGPGGVLGPSTPGPPPLDPPQGVTMGIRADQAMITWFGWGDVCGPRGRLRVEMNNLKRERGTM